jgi:hypothetical protein
VYIKRGKIMKKSNLLEVIKKVVRKEVRLAIKEELNKKEPSKTSQFGEMMEHADGLFNNENKQSYVNDPILNDVLNETANQPRNNTTGAEWPTMGGRELNSSDAPAGPGLASLMGMGNPNEMFGGKPSLQQMVPEDRQNVQIDDELATALTRDYSGLMKAIDKKRKI